MTRKKMPTAFLRVLRRNSFLTHKTLLSCSLFSDRYSQNNSWYVHWKWSSCCKRESLICIRIGSEGLEHHEVFKFCTMTERLTILATRFKTVRSRARSRKEITVSASGRQRGHLGLVSDESCASVLVRHWARVGRRAAIKRNPFQMAPRQQSAYQTLVDSECIIKHRPDDTFLTLGRRQWASVSIETRLDVRQ